MSDLVVMLRSLADSALDGTYEQTCKQQMRDAADEITRLRADRDKWHRVAMQAGAVTCTDGGHLYPLRDEVKTLRAELEAKRREGWQEIDERAKDGRVLLLRHGLTDDGSIYAGYYGMAKPTMGCGADARFPWVFLDPTNGINHMRDGDTGFTHYRDISAFPSTEGGRG